MLAPGTEAGASSRYIIPDPPNADSILVLGLAVKGIIRHSPRHDQDRRITIESRDLAITMAAMVKATLKELGLTRRIRLPRNAVRNPKSHLTSTTLHRRRLGQCWNAFYLQLKRDKVMGRTLHIPTEWAFPSWIHHSNQRLKLFLKNHIFTFSSSSLKPPVDGTSYYTRPIPKPRPS